MRKLKIKRKLVDLKGGACEKCGYNFYIGSLVFHHRDPEDKNFKFASGTLKDKSFKVLLEELEKCDLLCTTCHQEIHAEWRARGK